MIRRGNERPFTGVRSISLLVLVSIFLTSACGNNRRFDSAIWLKSDARARGRMSQDLVDGKTLLGKSVDEAKAVLGQPDFTYPSALQYKIDLGWAFKESYRYGLQVHLDEKRFVREVKIVD
jgi:hypothetical protein